MQDGGVRLSAVNSCCFAEAPAALQPSAWGCLTPSMRCLLILLLHGCVADRQEVRAWLRNRANASATEECTLEEACTLTAKLKRLHGRRRPFAIGLEKAWPALFGEEFKDRHNHVPSSYSTLLRPERREEAAGSGLTPHYLGKHRLSSPRTGPTSPGEYSGSHDPARGGLLSKRTAPYLGRPVAKAKLLHRKTIVSISRGRGWFIFEFEAIRTVSSEYDSAQVPRSATGS